MKATKDQVLKLCEEIHRTKSQAGRRSTVKPARLDTYPMAYVEGLAARVAELEAENKDLRDWAKVRSKMGGAK